MVRSSKVTPGRATLVAVVLWALLLVGALGAPAAQADGYGRLAGIGSGLGSGAVRLGDIGIVPGVRLTNVSLSVGVSRVRFSGGIELACSAGGSISGGGSGDVRFGRGLQWSVTLALDTSADGCGVFRGLWVTSAAPSTVTLRGDGKNISVETALEVGIRTTLIPGVTGFDGTYTIAAGGPGQAQDASIAGKGAGASFRAIVRPNGTFDLGFDLDLAIGPGTLAVTGSLTVPTPGAPLQARLAVDQANTLKLAPWLILRGIKLELNSSRLSLDATVELDCGRGTNTFRASGDVVDGVGTLAISSGAADCKLAPNFVLDGNLIGGQLILRRSGIDAHLKVEPLRFGVRSSLLGSISIGNFDLRLTSGCEGCGRSLKIGIATGVGLGLRRAPDNAELELQVFIGLLIDPSNFRISNITLTVGSLVNGELTPLAFLFQTDLIRQITQALNTAAGRASGSKLTCENPCVTTSQSAGKQLTTGSSGSGRAVRPRILSVVVQTASRRPTVRVRLSSTPGTARIEIQRRACLAGSCRWTIAQYAVAAADRRGNARLRMASPASRGSYRAVVRVGRAERAKVVGFKVS